MEKKEEVPELSNDEGMREDRLWWRHTGSGGKTRCTGGKQCGNEKSIDQQAGDFSCGDSSVL